MSNTALAGILAKTLLNLGPRRIPSGSFTDVATVDNGTDSKVMTVYSSCVPLGPPDAGPGFAIDYSHRVRLFATLTRAGSNISGEVPANRHFTVAAQRIAIRAAIFAELADYGDQPSPPNDRVKADVSILISDGTVGDGAQPTLWQRQALNTTVGSPFNGAQYDAGGIIASGQNCILIAAEGYNAGPSGRYLRFQDMRRVVDGPTTFFEFYVPSLSPFSLDLAPDGRHCARGVQWIASGTPGGVADNNAGFRVDAKYAFL